MRKTGFRVLYMLGLSGAMCLTTMASSDNASAQLDLRIRDYLTMPDPGKRDYKSQNNSIYARINFLREEPGADRNRLFVSDLDGPLYILDKRTKKLTTYLDFNGGRGRKGIFPHLQYDSGYASGLITFQFDPDYRRNGRFYTIHLENPSLPGSSLPDNKNFLGFDTKGYAVTQPVRTPGKTMAEAVLVEWTDTNTADTLFTGTARELLRIPYNIYIHPLGDLIFNPTAKPGDPDWRVLYISGGDGGSGEMTDLSVRYNPQRLDVLVGKILRIIPDLTIHQDTSDVSENGRYRVPRDNPFVTLPGARPEIWVYGLRNAHRMSWDVNPSDPSKNYLLADVIGLETWETVVIIHKGANYGYPEREGNQRLMVVTENGTKKNQIAALPEDDRIPLRVGDATANELVKPTYPVIQYGHVPDGGDAIASGFVYRGKIAAIRGKYIFGDITTGHLWWADLQEMVAADDGDPKTMAAIHPLHILWRNGQAKEDVYPSLAPIVSARYHERGGEAEYLPGLEVNVAKHRADIRLAVDGKGELYILSKSDGMIRKVIGAVP